MQADLHMSGSSHAILIGVSAYEYTELPPIRAARNSLRAMREVLAHPDLCGWSSECITTISNPISATELAVSIADLAEHTTDALILYYVGHGVLTDRGELCLSVTSTRPNRAKMTSLTWETVTDVLRASPARIRIGILDCCFAGQAIESLTSNNDSSIANIAHAEGVYTLTATTRNRTAHVPPPEEQDTECTSFTAELCDVVRTGIPFGPTQLTLGDIYPVLRQRLSAKGRPIPNQRGTDTAYQFPFTANAALAAPRTAPEPRDSRTLQERNIRTVQEIASKARARRDEIILRQRQYQRTMSPPSSNREQGTDPSLTKTRTSAGGLKLSGSESQVLEIELSANLYKLAWSTSGSGVFVVQSEDETAKLQVVESRSGRVSGETIARIKGDGRHIVSVRARGRTWTLDFQQI